MHITQIVNVTESDGESCLMGLDSTGMLYVYRWAHAPFTDADGVYRQKHGHTGGWEALPSGINREINAVKYGAQKLVDKQAALARAAYHNEPPAPGSE